MSVGANIKRLRDLNDLTQEQLAEKLGVTRESVVKWETGKMNIRDRHVSKIVELFGVEPDDIKAENFGLASQEQKAVVFSPSYSYSVAPIVGNVAAGEACEAIENIEGELMIPPAFESDHPKAKFLKISGESMNKYFQSGSYALYDPDLEVRDGDIAVVIVNGDEATVKRVFFAGDTVVLHPESTMEDTFFDRAINVKDPEAPSITFAGRVFWRSDGDREMRY